MKEKKDYSQIMILFDPQGKNPLSEFCRELVREDNPEEAELLKAWFEAHKKEGADEIEEKVFMREIAHLEIGFAAGYVVGQDYDIADEELSAIVEDLRERILKAKALPYFQRTEKEEPQPKTREGRG